MFYQLEMPIGTMQTNSITLKPIPNHLDKWLQYNVIKTMKNWNKTHLQSSHMINLKLPWNHSWNLVRMRALIQFSTREMFKSYRIKNNFKRNNQRKIWDSLTLSKIIFRKVMMARNSKFSNQKQHIILMNLAPVISKKLQAPRNPFN